MSTPGEFDAVSNDALWAEALRTFDQGDYFETHEVCEELWRRHDGALSDFYQGILQAAVALYHFGNGNFHGAKLLTRQAKARLSGLPDSFHEVDLGRFRREFFALMQPVVEGAPDLKPLAPDEAPRLHPAPPARETSDTCNWDAQGPVQPA
jgi:hypothetical protein